MAVTVPLDPRPGAPESRVVRLPAELDLAESGDLRSAIAAAIRSGHGPIVFDCTELSFIDASGVGTLVWGANSAADAGREVRLLNPGEAMSRLLGLARVGHRFGLGGG